MKIKCMYGLLVFAALLILASCKISYNVRIGFVENHWNGYLVCNYKSFTGNEYMRKDFLNGDSAVIDYEVHQKSGSLLLQFKEKGSDTTIWKTEITGSATQSDKIEIPVVNAGKYELIITGKKSSGSFKTTLLKKSSI